jgi:hypothetical protein
MVMHSAATHLSRCLCVSFSLLAANGFAQDTPATSAPLDAPRALSASAAEPGLKVFLTHRTDALGRRCTLQGVASSGALRFVACGAAGLWVCRLFPDGTATLLAEQDVGGSASGFFVQDGRLWVEVSSVRAQRIDFAETPRLAAAALEPALPALPPPTAAAPPAPAPSPVADKPARLRAAPRAREDLEAARAVVVKDEHVIVDFGVDSVPVGDRVAFYEANAVSREEINGGYAPTLQAVGKVVDVNAGRARVEIGLNERVRLDSRAEHTQLPATASTFAPPRAAGVWDVAFLARPFIVIDNLGVGGFIDARVGYHTQAPFHVEASIAPLAFATARSGVSVPVAALVSASYDSHVFEVGLGLGGQTVNAPNISLDPGTGTTLGQRLRLGARDGANIEAFSYVALFHSEFHFSALRVQAQLPVGRRTWLLAAGGGGDVGLGYGEIGLRVLMLGNGGADSLFLSTVIGGVNVFERCNFSGGSVCNEVDYVGPMLGVGAEWRL